MDELAANMAANPGHLCTELSTHLSIKVCHMFWKLTRLRNMEMQQCCDDVHKR